MCGNDENERVATSHYAKAIYQIYNNFSSAEKSVTKVWTDGTTWWLHDSTSWGIINKSKENQTKCSGNKKNISTMYIKNP